MQMRVPNEVVAVSQVVRPGKVAPGRPDILTPFARTSLIQSKLIYFRIQN